MLSFKALRVQAGELGAVGRHEHMHRLIAATFLTFVVLSAFGTTILPPKRVRARLNPVFSAYDQVVQAETQQAASALDLALSRVLEDRSRLGDEALAVLLGFYLGEHSGEDISCELIARGAKVLPFLRKYRSAQITLPGLPTAPLRRGRSQYHGVIERIRAGEACTREP